MPASRPLPVEGYQTLIALDQPFTPAAAPAEPETFDDLTGRLRALLSDDPAAARLGITAQHSPEPAGTAKITRGYHLPARYGPGLPKLRRSAK